MSPIEFTVMTWQYAIFDDSGKMTSETVDFDVITNPYYRLCELKTW
jgi:hypothetical protein